MPKALHDAEPTKHTQPFTGERGFRQGRRNKDTPSFKHGCLQVVEQSRCRTHRQQTTTVAQKQSQQSVLKGIGIENKHFFEKTYFFYKLSRYEYIMAAFVQLVHLLTFFWCIPPNTPLYFLTYYSICDKIRLSKCKFKRCFL